MRNAKSQRNLEIICYTRDDVKMLLDHRVQYTNFILLQYVDEDDDRNQKSSSILTKLYKRILIVAEAMGERFLMD